MCPDDGAACGCKPAACNEPPLCPMDGPDCCKDDPCNAPNPPETCPCDGPYTEACTDDCDSPNPPASCPCGGPYTSACPLPVDCSQNLALQVNGAEGDGAELEDSALMALEGKFRQARFPGVTVEMWVKDNTLPMHRTVYFGGGEFRDQGLDEEESCILSGFALGQWNGMLTFDVATADGVQGAGCGVHVRSPDWVLGVHKGKWVHVAGTYDGVTGETSLYIDGKIVHTDFEGSGALTWPAAGSAQFVMGRNGNFISSSGGSGGMDGELDELRVWTTARSLDDLVGGMHKTMPDTGAFGPYPMATVALYLRFECQKNKAAQFHRVCSAAEWPMALQLGGPTTQLVESGAPLEMLEDPSDSCPAGPSQPGPISWTTWSWPEAVQRDSTWSHATLRTKPHAMQRLAQIKSTNKGFKTSPAHNKLTAAASRMLAQGAQGGHARQDALKKSPLERQVKDKRQGWLHQRLAGGKLRTLRASRAALLVASQAYASTSKS